MKFKVGDKVRVREDLEVGKSYNGCYFESSMAKLKGKVVEITYLDSDSYSIKELFMICKYCESNKIIKIDKKQNRTQYFCENCESVFTKKEKE